MKIKEKLLLSSNGSVLFMLFLGGMLIYWNLKGITEKQIENELNTTTQSVFNLVKTSVDSAILNYLRSASEKTKDELTYFYNLQKSGIISEQEAKRQASELIYSKKIGKSGYIYCANSNGVVQVHPSRSIIGVNFSGKFKFIEQLLRDKNGYQEYDWKNPEEPHPKAKAMYSAYFEEWDWIISATTYRDEFLYLLDRESLKKTINSININNSGYVYIMDYNGVVIHHPEYPDGDNHLEAKDEHGNLFVQEMIKNKDGKIRYKWKNPSEKQAESKIALYKNLPEMKWIVVATLYEDQVYKPIHNLRNIISAVIVSVMIVLLLVNLWTSSYIIRPLDALTKTIREMETGNLDIRAEVKTTDEFGELALNFNSMSDKLHSSFEQIKEYNEHLEEKVASRTIELESTLDKVNQLKNQQDGDYFLTTLITNPLMQNRSKSQTVKIDFFIEQKKKFEFKGKKGDLGGDICISGNLNFSGKKYTMFFNGDAMGKSMQGAGGALVIGSVINSIMARSAANHKVLSISPEKWLNDSYQEVQRVMEAFDGSMMVSCVMGLINEETGFVMYFNAEHPFSVLYRDKQASFIEKEISVHKIGTPINHDLKMFSFKMLPGDIIFCGSDGKDDLLLKTDDGEKTINQNEELFLKVVESTNGEISKIYRSLYEYGELTDDLSILKISYLADKNEISPMFSKPISYEFIKTLIKEKNYTEALYSLEEIADYQNLTYLFYKGYCLHKLKQNKEAAELLENGISILRDDISVIKLLGRIYYDLGRYREASEYFLHVSALEPDNLKIHSYLKKIGLMQEELNSNNTLI